LEEDLQIMELIIARFSKLDKEREALTQLEKDKKLTALKYIAYGVIGLIYFSSSFFIGQAMALAIAGLFVAGTAPLSWPIVLASVAIGLSALAVYWYVERPSIEKLVSRLFGLDQDKIDEFCNPEKVAAQKAKLEQLKTNITVCKDYMAANFVENIECKNSIEEANKQIKALKELNLVSKQTNSLSELDFAEKPDNFFSTKRSRSNSLTENQPSIILT
jgi:hypothetical protein